MEVKPVQWSRLRHEYERGATYRELAEQYGVSAAAVGRRSKAENWGRRGSAQRELTVEQAAAQVAQRLLAAANQTLEDDSAPLSVKEIKDLAGLVREALALRQLSGREEPDAGTVRVVLEGEVERWSE